MRARWGYRLALVVGVVTLMAEVNSMAGRPVAGEPAAAPEIHGRVWINGEPTNLAALRGGVVWVEFWTYG